MNQKLKLIEGILALIDKREDLDTVAVMVVSRIQSLYYDSRESLLRGESHLTPALRTLAIAEIVCRAGDQLKVLDVANADVAREKFVHLDLDEQIDQLPPYPEYRSNLEGVDWYQDKLTEAAKEKQRILDNTVPHPDTEDEKAADEVLKKYTEGNNG